MGRGCWALCAGRTPLSLRPPSAVALVLQKSPGSSCWPGRRLTAGDQRAGLPSPPGPGCSARPGARRPGRALCAAASWASCAFSSGGEEARVALVQGLGGLAGFLASVAASTWRPAPTSHGSHTTEALGEADSGVHPPCAGAGVFFLSSAEGDQISFLFDCIVRGISPTKGPFGLRPVLPGECVAGRGGALPGQRVRGAAAANPRWAPGVGSAHTCTAPPSQDAQRLRLPGPAQVGPPPLRPERGLPPRPGWEPCPRSLGSGLWPRLGQCLGWRPPCEVGSWCPHVVVVGPGGRRTELAWPSPRFPGVGGAPLLFKSPGLGMLPAPGGHAGRALPCTG